MSATVLYMSMSLDGFFDEIISTGAVVAGRGTFEPAGSWGGDHHGGVPIFVLTRRKPDQRDPEHIELERTRIIEGERGVTHMHYRVRKLHEASHGS